MRLPAIKSTVVVFLSIFAMPALSQGPGIPPVPEGFIVTPVMRTSIIVRNMDESLKLYRDILGLRPWFEGPLEGEALNTLVGTTGKSMRNVILQSGDIVHANVGLFEYVGEETEKPDIIPEVRTGDVAIVFYTNDIFAIHDAVKAAGYTIISRPVALYRREGSSTQNVEMIFFDADGIALNLIQRGVPVEAINE
ncbi:MAG: VOC family protein [Rhodospirillaceae bacterium]|jgi:catechol 2,3-dioxygenase-like lactoylglutathione lyase family enzyme|nr:VOC family protein [Rhodospirillaceae bacterium]